MKESVHSINSLPMSEPPWDSAGPTGQRPTHIIFNACVAIVLSILDTPAVYRNFSVAPARGQTRAAGHACGPHDGHARERSSRSQRPRSVVNVGGASRFAAPGEGHRSTRAALPQRSAPAASRIAEGRRRGGPWSPRVRGNSACGTPKQDWSTQPPISLPGT